GEGGAERLTELAGDDQLPGGFQLRVQRLGRGLHGTERRQPVHLGYRLQERLADGVGLGHQGWADHRTPLVGPNWPLKALQKFRRFISSAVAGRGSAPGANNRGETAWI